LALKRPVFDNVLKRIWTIIMTAIAKTA